MEDTKWCRGCEENKPLAEFHRNSRNRDGRETRCKGCKKAWRDAYYVENGPALRVRRKELYWRDPQVVRDRHRDYYNAHPHYRWEANYRARCKEYGVTPVVVSFTREQLVAAYGDACYHCGGAFEDLDHLDAVIDGGHHTLEKCRPSCHRCNAVRELARRAAAGIADRAPDGKWIALADTGARLEPVAA